MATIEEIRDKPEDNILPRQLSSGQPTAESSPILLCMHPAWNGSVPRETCSPDDVVFRLTNGFNVDTFWVTADGQLHFGAQALAGLTRHVTKELTKALSDLNDQQKYEAFRKLDALNEDIGPVQQVDQPHATLKEALAQMEARWAKPDHPMCRCFLETAFSASWDCRQCGCHVTKHIKTPREQVARRLCQPCYVQLKDGPSYLEPLAGAETCLDRIREDGACLVMEVPANEPPQPAPARNPFQKYDTLE